MELLFQLDSKSKSKIITALVLAEDVHTAKDWKLGKFRLQLLLDMFPIKNPRL